MNENTNEYNFKVLGGFEVSSNLKTVKDCMGNVTGFVLEDGREVQLVVALEVIANNRKDYSYITSPLEMEDIGFEGLSYQELTFVPTSENENPESTEDY